MSKFRNYDKYEIYEDGRIWSYKYKKFLKPKTEKKGYQRVRLTDNEGKSKCYLVHRVVFEAVSGEPIPENLEVNHINEDKTDNRFCNLNLLTHNENINFGTGIARRAKQISKQVGAYKDGNLIMTFQSTIEAHIQGFECGSVSKCCNGKMKTHKGYTWKYL